MPSIDLKYGSRIIPFEYDELRFEILGDRDERRALNDVEIGERLDSPIGTESIEELATIPTKVKPQEVQLAKQVIATFEKKLDLNEYRDEYREGLQKIIDAKIAGEEIVAPSVEMPPKVVNLMEALKKSLDTVSANKKPSAKADLKVVKKASRAEPKRRRA